MEIAVREAKYPLGNDLRHQLNEEHFTGLRIV